MTLLLLALALSMDAFAAALSHGASARPAPTATNALRVGLAFGVAQALMPLLGWSLGAAFATVISRVDHWIAFVLLAFIGGRMVREGLRRERPQSNSSSLASGRGLLLMALATSIDAAAAGVTLVLLDQSVLLACATIGGVTLVMSIAGVLLGKRAGTLLGTRAEVVGGLVLIGIGTKILIEHLSGSM
jgi:manganese efflux pump family protein